MHQRDRLVYVFVDRSDAYERENCMNCLPINVKMPSVREMRSSSSRSRARSLTTTREESRCSEDKGRTVKFVGEKIEG